MSTVKHTIEPNRHLNPLPPTPHKKSPDLHDSEKSPLKVQGGSGPPASYGPGCGCGNDFGVSVNRSSSECRLAATASQYRSCLPEVQGTADVFARQLSLPVELRVGCVGEPRRRSIESRLGNVYQLLSYHFYHQLQKIN